MAKFNIALIPGDGIGPDIVRASLPVLEAVGAKYGHSFVYKELLAGGIAIDETGHTLPEETVEVCKASDAILLGAVGGPKWDSLPGKERPERALLGLRSALGLYANIRPAKLYKALSQASPLHPQIVANGIDMVIVRELTGGLYFGDSGRYDSPQGQTAFDTEAYSVEEVRRIAVSAFDLAMTRRKKLTSIDKANVLESSRLWREVVLEVAKDYPEVELDHLYVDNASMQLIVRPSDFDVIVSTNMFGDIISDEAAMITGSIGMLPSASLGKKGMVGMYEPIHGSAPDIAGKDLANPLATILSLAMMFDLSFGLKKEAAKIERAVEEVLDLGYRTGDIAPKGDEVQAGPIEIVGTAQMSKLVTERI